MADIIEVKNLSKTFGANKAVDDLSFSVHQGSLFSFLGQNGAGKSTTINMLIGLLEKDSGEIFYDGKMEFAGFKDQMATVFQNNILDDLLTVEENLLLYGALYQKDKEEMKKRYQEIVLLLSLDDMRKKKFKTLSGGQKRRVEIARALWSRPRILFLDEPTTGLDPKTRIDVWKILHEIRKETGMTIFLTTHYMEETAEADEIVIIHKGKMVAQGSPAELKADYSKDKLLITPMDAALLESQLSEKGLRWEKTADTYAIVTEGAEYAIESLYELKGNIRFFESKKGSMDDVFLNAVGENIGEGK